uniref:collagen alpha-1(X) chain-like n=1 Tax=Agelaius phoeniceus TaxID=39638 RepID=UPI0023EC8766|nr:collagen alpha-1(X) chain-like [Agelaius phoeniceus]XP_054498440.1 collagen alpha-1(X) chain-like [Agelaius phoeniceus]XP_054498441.1 collagen alpha-1(X) chain-like [Agelaius phoeniceus]XP_054498442.1 collagen alpha-1(X) chain-like [Agelaius phoeniceus]XP_054498443.1 collagen alpha-1(X) chain-like [Agelaius phoeniceus]XP_054498444.1 collagen alpha-1(X) chain-like [Agelaius phoeniceus]XP_054498446.1 collagen alpha-1(X) chain-like [Agelaius phoeniceus]XP_054498447.1 collagen alpha-1(X) chai
MAVRSCGVPAGPSARPELPTGPVVPGPGLPPRLAVPGPGLSPRPAVPGPAGALSTPGCARPGRGSLQARLCPARGSLHARLCPARGSLHARLCPARRTRGHRQARLCPAGPCVGGLGLQGAPEARPAPGPARPALAAEAEAEIGCQGALNMARRNAERWLCLGMERPASLPFSCAPDRCLAKLLCERSRELPQAAKQSF